MKNNLLLVFSTFIAGLVYSQQHDVVITGSKKINKKATPQQIVDSLKTRFPDATAIQYYQAPASGVSKGGWAVTEEDNLPEDGSLTRCHWRNYSSAIPRLCAPVQAPGKQ